MPLPEGQGLVGLTALGAREREAFDPGDTGTVENDVGVALEARVGEVGADVEEVVVMLRGVRRGRAVAVFTTDIAPVPTPRRTVLSMTTTRRSGPRAVRLALEDRLAPDLGLDDDGSMKLDFGTRSFTVGFDEALRPFVKDSEGTRLKELPKPKQTDDEEKARAASESWGQLKKDAKQAASLQILRLEMAMCGARRFSATDFVELFVKHPLVVHIVRRLVWAIYDDNGTITATFLVAEDRTFAGANDDSFTLSDTATVGIPQPLELNEAVSAQWSQVFGDYESVQPFAQLGRPTAVADAAQQASKVLDIVNGVTVKTGKVLGLEARRWRRGAPQDAGVVWWMEKHLADGRTIFLDLDPGLYVGMLSESPEQKLGSAIISSDRHNHHRGNDSGAVFGSLDAIMYSELVRDLEGLKG